MRVIFFGTAAFAVPSLEQLVTHGQTVVMCVTQPDRPRGRGLRSEPSPVKRAALRLGVPLSQPTELEARQLGAVHPDVGVVVAYGELIPRELLSLPAHGMLGVHPSLLPAYRGAAPVAWALLSGETTTGVTIFRLNERLDAGEIVLQQRVPILPREDAEALTGRLASLGAERLLEALEAIGTGRATFTPQEETQATFAPKLTKADGRIDWVKSAEVIERLVRAMAPWPGAVTEWRGAALRVWAASVGPDPGAALYQPCTSPVQGQGGTGPGTIRAVAPDRLSVATGSGMLEITEVQPAGRRRMSVRESLAGHRLSIGDKLGGS